MMYGKELKTVRLIRWHEREDFYSDRRNEVCMAEEAFRSQMSKPPWQRSNTVMVACRCPKCRVAY